MSASPHRPDNGSSPVKYGNATLVIDEVDKAGKAKVSLLHLYKRTQ